LSEIVIGEDGLARPPWAATDPLLTDLMTKAELMAAGEWMEKS